MSLPAGCLPYLLSITTKHGIYKFDAVRQIGRDDIAGSGRETAMRVSLIYSKLLFYLFYMAAFCHLCKVVLGHFYLFITVFYARVLR